MFTAINSSSTPKTLAVSMTALHGGDGGRKYSFIGATSFLGPAADSLVNIKNSE